MLKSSSNILLAFYGDDFTGSTDALEFICRAGANAMLFIEPPSAEILGEFPGLDAYGVAGVTRSLPVAEMEPVLLAAFEKIKATGTAHVHYKTCSTFDASPGIGSIGKAIDCGAKVFAGKFVPVPAGTPALGRFCLFGNLFARMGIGSNGAIYRLDRHPSMSKHPVTPADESDLRLHIGGQTQKSIGLIDILQQEATIEEWNEFVKDNDIVLLDVLYENQLAKIGEWLNGQRKAPGALFSAGPSAVEMALGSYWNNIGVWKNKQQWKQLAKASPLLVISGSCSPVTAAQIDYALAAGFKELVLDAATISNGEAVEQTVLPALSLLIGNRQHVIVHTGRKQDFQLPSQKLGTALGNIARLCVEQCGVKRVVIAGGDTSSYAARAMEIAAVAMIAPLVIGAPMCSAWSENKLVNGIEVNFKGGQVGAADYFERAAGEISGR